MSIMTAYPTSSLDKMKKWMVEKLTQVTLINDNSNKDKKMDDIHGQVPNIVISDETRQSQNSKMKQSARPKPLRNTWYNSNPEIEEVKKSTNENGKDGSSSLNFSLDQMKQWVSDKLATAISSESVFLGEKKKLIKRCYVS